MSNLPPEPQSEPRAARVTAPAGPPAEAGTPKKKSDLKPRLIAGAAMAVVALALTYAGPAPFALLVVLVAVLMCWEWGRVVRGTDFGPQFILHAGTIVAAVAAAAYGQPLAALAAVAAGALVLVLAPIGERRAMSAVGVAYVGLPVVALLWFRADAALGLYAVLFLFVVVWTSDIAAFAAGRSIGGPKLWPRVSPNKTWSGFLGGVGSTAVAGALFAQMVPGASSLRLALIALALAIVAQAGDLAESALKRWFGVKDSSSIIPGHGGVMDRADSIVAVSIAAAILVLLIDMAAPARALLLGG